jgi:plastocyanin
VKVRSFAVAVLGLLVLVPAARADQTIYAGPPSQFYTSSVTIDQGQKVTFTNLDTIEHDVTAASKGPDGKPLFSSPLGGPGSSSDVAGTQYLTTGTYDFGCSLHSNMKGTITVTSAGTPAQRPGSGSGSGSGSTAAPQPASAPSDTSKPKVAVHLVDTSLGPVRRRRALRLHVATDKPITIGLTVRAGRTTFAAATTKVGAKGKTVSLRLTPAGLRLARRGRVLRLTLIARAADDSNNKVSTKGSFTLAR